MIRPTPRGAEPVVRSWAARAGCAPGANGLAACPSLVWPSRCLRAGWGGRACVGFGWCRAGERGRGCERRAGAVVEQPGLGFAELLRQLRELALLTQEELAEAAGLSPRSVSDLERGIHRTARKDTAVLLAGALGLAEPVRALFVAAARGQAPVAEVLTALQGARPR